MKKTIFVVLAATAMLGAQPPLPLSIADCYLMPDLTLPGVRATPGLSGGPGTGWWNGSIQLKNETASDIRVKSSIVHVLDGYGKLLFDIDPKTYVLIPGRATSSLPLRATYLGGVSSFKFSCDLTVEGQGGKDQLISLPMMGPASGASSKKIPGY
ncbi:MAG: hypothetical protein KF760_07540 [Candidatus Eremiobacteraeota bacterium]|nr:hypothetical protein [Candidatus Eremiobacteraeota bacterium]MCW5869743.1 hypothetical protein [Candidatus Eremiobacteraeota bacterium]